jgi:ATP-dependent exoDNAse (exonuclease V) beta subunit
LRPSGQQVLANVLRICDLARAYELTGGFSFRGFVEELTAQADKTESAEAPVLEEASDGVRLMTVHTAKGLEFPVVILADMTANLHSAEPDRFVDAQRGLCATRLLRNCSPRELLEHVVGEAARERAEGVRVCYVAATRARDLLVVPAVGDQPWEGWLGPLNKALYPDRKLERRSESCEAVAFAGDRTVLWRPFRSSNIEDESIRPGLHTAQNGDHRVLWWDPAQLDLEVEQEHGLRGVDMLKTGGRAEESLAAYREWRDSRARRVESSRTPELNVVRVTDIEEDPPEYPVSFESALAAERTHRGTSFGSLVHAVLRDVPLHPARADIEGLASMHARILGSTAADTALAVGVVAAVVEHDLWREAVSSASLHREWPVVMRMPDGRLLEGVLDLAYKNSSGWVVVDFKTDADIEFSRAVYVRQLRWYLHALASATGQKVRGVLLQA